MSDGAEVIKLVHDARPDVPQCPHCKYFVPGRRSDPGGRCEITFCSIASERMDYVEDQSCGPEARWFRPRAEGVEPTAAPATSVAAGSRMNVWLALAIVALVGASIMAGIR